MPRQLNLVKSSPLVFGYRVLVLRLAAVVVLLGSMVQYVARCSEAFYFCALADLGHDPPIADAPRKCSSKSIHGGLMLQTAIHSTQREPAMVVLAFCMMLRLSMA
eukprot:4973249-Amphidinium_carterae.1